MTRFVIKIGLKDYTDAGLEAFASRIASMMNGNSFYTTPSPTLIALGTLITTYHNAVTAWGTSGNRGSHLEHEEMLDARVALEYALTELANYCMNTTSYNSTAFTSAGWEVKRESVPVGLVGPVLNFRQFISRVVPSGAVKLKWDRPAEAPRGSISVYRILNGLTSDINAATQIALTTKTSYTDLDAGSRASNFYWVIPVCTAGNGGIADVVVGYPQGPVVS